MSFSPDPTKAEETHDLDLLGQEIHWVYPEKPLKIAAESDEEGKWNAEVEFSVGMRAVWFKTAKDVVRGTVMFVGKITGMGGAQKIGLRLDERKGPKGFVGRQDLFQCEPGYGVIANQHQVMPEERYNSTMGITSELASKKVKIKDRIVWIDPKEEAKTAQHGTVLFLGEVTGLTGIQMGVEFDGLCGLPGWTGKVSKKQYFTCKTGRGRLISRDEIDTWWPVDTYQRRQNKVKMEEQHATDGSDAASVKKTPEEANSSGTTFGSPKASAGPESQQLSET